MNRSYPLVEIHYALWAVLSVPLGFAGLFFLVPGLIFEWGAPLLLISGLLILYVSSLTRNRRAAWLVGLVAHAVLVVGAVYYLPRWPLLLGVPLLAANLYSLAVLLFYRGLWAGAEPTVQPALTA
ncbi:MAG: hypothetical protein PVJ43_15890 [Gemmatimonadales bacterium]|jgi:hypothetical protein